jgi:hypothetical protein
VELKWVRKAVSAGEIMETGGLIAHAVFESGNEEVMVAGDHVTMMALMEGMGL